MDNSLVPVTIERYEDGDTFVLILVVMDNSLVLLRE